MSLALTWYTFQTLPRTMFNHSALSFCRGLAPSSGIGGTGAGSFGLFGSFGFGGAKDVNLQGFTKCWVRSEVSVCKHWLGRQHVVSCGIDRPSNREGEDAECGTSVFGSSRLPK